MCIQCVWFHVGLKQILIITSTHPFSGIREYNFGIKYSYITLWGILVIFVNIILVSNNFVGNFCIKMSQLR